MTSDHDLLIAWLRSAPNIPDRVRQLGVWLALIDKARHAEPTRLAPLSPGRWALQRVGGVREVLDYTGSRCRRLEAATRFLGLMLAEGQPLRYASGDAVPADELLPGANAMRNALRLVLAPQFERLGFAEVARELLRISIASDGGIRFRPSGSVVVATE